jgi:hypothetical protein
MPLALPCIHQRHARLRKISDQSFRWRLPHV